MSYINPITPIYLCVLQASQVNSIDVNILMSVIHVEGGRVGVESKNRNGSYDLGIMQINSHSWIPLISKVFFSDDIEKAYKVTRDDACFNISIGAWILKQSIYKEGGNVWEGVGRYHSRTPSIKYRYIKKVRNAYSKIYCKTDECQV